MYVGRLCAILDSFIGRGYKLTADEISTVRFFYNKLEKVMEEYPQHLSEYTKDQAITRETLSNIKFNVLLPAQSTPPTIPTEGPMSVQLAEQVVKQRPNEVQSFLRRHLTAIESTPFPSMRDVEDLLTMTGRPVLPISYSLGINFKGTSHGFSVYELRNHVAFVY